MLTKTGSSSPASLLHQRPLLGCPKHPSNTTQSDSMCIKWKPFAPLTTLPRPRSPLDLSMSPVFIPSLGICIRWSLVTICSHQFNQTMAMSRDSCLKRDSEVEQRRNRQIFLRGRIHQIWWSEQITSSGRAQSLSCSPSLCLPLHHYSLITFLSSPFPTFFLTLCNNTIPISTDRNRAMGL